MKNDITYEYRVFTNRLIDIETMEVGKCTSKIIKELKQKDKVDSRFFHTSDTDEWFFCWNGELQKLNLKGDSDVNDALAEVRELINNVKVSVENANTAAESAQNAAREANAAVESIENLENVVNTKADAAVVDALSDKVAAIKLDDYALKSDIPSLKDFATKSFVGEEIAKSVPTKVSELTNDSGYLTAHQDISGKQDVINDLDVIRTNAEKGANALQEVPAEYVTEKELEEKGYLTEHQSLDNYYTKDDVNGMINDINALIGQATNYIKNTILA